MAWKKVSSQKERKSTLKDKLGNIDIADFYIYFANISKIFIENYGFKRSVEESRPIDNNGNPLPLYTYPAIEYLNSLNFSHKKIFEFGSGNSTLFWLNKGAIVNSVESNKMWFKKLTQEIGDNSKHKFIFANKVQYYDAILEDDERYDVIIIDGSENRLESTKRALERIKEDGMMIIDNSDWFENSTRLIREKLDFIQIDFYGFKPSKSNTSVTSVFFSRSSNFMAIETKQPSFPIGGIARQSQNDFELEGLAPK